MYRFVILLLTVLALVAARSPAVAAGNESAQHLNVVIFLVDDMGWMDCGAYGSRYYETPNIDRLATQGMRLTDYYAANPLCSPTRASILTGKYPGRLGFTTAAGHRPPLAANASMYEPRATAEQPLILPISQRHLPLAEVTLAEALREAGYRTAHLGKWHLGLEPEHWPEEQGFDVAFHGHPDPGPPSYFSPYGFPAGTVTNGPDGEYITDRLTDEAIGFIESSADQPFFLNLWHYGVHGPWGHKVELTRQYAERTDPRGKQDNPIMASMLQSIDESLGRILAALDELELTDRTLVIFTSDNGGNVHSNTRSDRNANIEPGHRRWPMIESWRKYAGYEPPTNNAPLRSGKGNLYEGGVRVPCIVRLPGVVEPGSTSSVPAMSIDLYPTIVELAGVPRPEQHFDGVSLAPLLRQEGQLERQELFNYFPHGGPTRPPGVTVRLGDWKLTRWFLTSSDFPASRELYNLADDLGEQHNLADQEPERVAELDARIDRFLSEVVAYPPKPNPQYDPQLGSLEGWVAKSCRALARDGVLHVQPIDRPAMLAMNRLSSLRAEGPLVLTVRLRRAEGGRLRVQWRTTAQKTFPAEGQEVFAELTGGEAWQDVQVRLPLEGRVAHLRLFLPEEGATEIDHIALGSAEQGTQNRLTWDFDN